MPYMYERYSGKKNLFRGKKSFNMVADRCSKMDNNNILIYIISLIAQN